MGFVKEPDVALDKAWQHHRREVRRLHEKLFYRPLLEAVAKIPETDVRLSSEAAGDRLAALGYSDPAAALRNLEALTSGVTRTANIQKALLPAMLQWFAECADPDAGLFGFRRISEALGRTPWYLKTLRDEGQVAERLARVLATSRYATTLLETEPQGVQILAGELTPQPADALTEEMLASSSRQEDVEKAVRAIRAVRRRELFRLAAGEVLGLTDVADVGAGLSRLTDATLEATLVSVSKAVQEQRELDERPTRLAIVAMGRYGGFELSYGSDADVMFVHQPRAGRRPAGRHGVRAGGGQRDPAPPGPARWRPAAGGRRRTAPGGQAGTRWCARSTPTPPTTRSGRRSGSSRRCCGPTRSSAIPSCATSFHELIDPLRFPEDGISDDDVFEVRRIKARIDNERLPRGGDPQLHFKLGRGGLADIEWTVQLLQMQHAGRVPSLRTPQTLAALEAAREADLISAEDCDLLCEGWRTVSRLRNAVTLARGKGSDHLPGEARERAAVASIMGYPPGSTDQMVNDYLRTTRRSRSVVDRIFWE